MKIGILTFHSALNQGAVLQAYALQHYLQQQGHEVEFINYCPKKHYTWRDFVAKSWASWTEKLRNNINGIKYRQNDGFFKILECTSHRYYSYDELQRNPPIYELYICGSDQVWHFPRNLNPIFLFDFLPDGANMISYAASLGQHLPPKSLQEHFKSSLSRFNAISIREDNGVRFVSELFNGERKIYHVVDPTLLLPATAYDKIAESVNIPRNGYIASYILSILEPAHGRIIKAVSSFYGANILNLRNPDTCVYMQGAENRIVTPTQWLSYIKNAKAVVCSSFHAVVFSLLFHKPFIVMQPAKLKELGGNLRVVQLLAPLGLSHHCIYDIEDNNVGNLLSEHIDWAKVDEAIEQMSARSKAFLKEYAK